MGVVFYVEVDCVLGFVGCVFCVLFNFFRSLWGGCYFYFIEEEGEIRRGCLV